MLPLLANQLLVAMNADQLALVHRQTLTKKVLAQKISTWSQTEANSWSPALDALDQQLEVLNLGLNTKVLVTLGSEFVRYMTLPPQTQAMSNADALAYAKAVYLDIYGAAADNWQISCQDTPPAQPILVSAIDQSLLNGLAALAQKYRLSLNSVQPYLMTAFNRLSLKPRANQSGLLAIIEQQRLLLLHLQGAYCQQVRNLPLSGDWQDDLNKELAREALMGQGAAELMLYAPAHKNITIQLNRNAKRLSVNTKTPNQAPMLEALL